MCRLKIAQVVVSVFLVISIFALAGCLNYKAYQGDQPASPPADQELVDKIAALERDLQIEDRPSASLPEVPVVEPVVAVPVPQEVTVALDEQPKESTSSEVQRVTVKENELVALNVKVKDLDQDETTVAFTPPLDRSSGKWQTKYGDAGEYEVKVTVSDGKVKTVKNVLVVVQRVNVPPVIESLADITVKEGEEVKISPKTSDPNGDKVTITFSDSLKEGTWKTDHTSAGDYEVVVTASDGELESKETLKLKVTDVNVLPELSGVDDVTIKEGETVRLEPQVSDKDNDKLTVTISDPVGDDGVWETTFTDHGRYPITITVKDGKDTVTKTVNVMVTDVNVPPEIVEITLG